MKHIALFLLFMCLIGALAVVFLRIPGSVHITWLDYKIQMSLGVLGLLWGFSFAVLWFLIAFFQTLLSLPGWMQEKMQAYRHQKGQKALSQAFLALTSKQGHRLMREGVKSQSDPENTEIGLWLTAEGAFLLEKWPLAHLKFQALSRHEKLAFLGHQGLIRLALREKDWPQAWEWVQEALTYEPLSPWLWKTAYHLALRTQHPEAALKAAEQLKKLNFWSETTYQHKYAKALCALSNHQSKQGHLKEALKSAKRAFSLGPSSETSFFYATLLHARGAHQQALKVIATLWAIQPSSRLAYLYWEILIDHPQMSSEDRRTAIHTLIDQNPNHPESLLALGRMGLKEQLWGQARAALQTLVTQGNASCEGYALLAELEIQEYQDEAAALRWAQKGLDLATNSL